LDKVEDEKFPTILSLFMYDSSAKLYMPIGHCLLLKTSTDTLQSAISWFQREFGAFLKPSIIMTDFNFDLFHAVHTLYTPIPKFISITSFLQNLFKSQLRSQNTTAQCS